MNDLFATIHPAANSNIAKCRDPHYLARRTIPIAPLPALDATLHDDGTATCGEHKAAGEDRIGDLCCLLVERGHPDAALRFRWPDGRPCAFVPSFSVLIKDAT